MRLRSQSTEVACRGITALPYEAARRGLSASCSSATASVCVPRTRTVGEAEVDKTMLADLYGMLQVAAAVDLRVLLWCSYAGYLVGMTAG